MALFKPLLGKRENLPTTLTSGYAYFCTDDGSFWIDYKDSDGIIKRKQINAQEAEKIIGYDIVATLTNNNATIPVSSAVFSAIESVKNDLNTDLGGRIDDVEDNINTTNQNLSGISQEFENYKTTNNSAVSANATNIANNKSAIEEIQGDYLTSADKEELQDNISKVSEKATSNASAIEVLNGEGAGSVKQSIDNAFNEFAANVTNDDVINTYKELIDYAATHNSEFATLVGEIDTINTHVGEVEADLSSYKTEVLGQFTETDTTINSHVTNTNNPHGVTKEQLGLGNIENTSDLEKPVSHAMQEALDDKADAGHTHESLDNHLSDIENPHNVTKDQIGLGSVDNTSDLDKPISNATQAVLDEKADEGHTHDASDITDGTLGVGYGGTGYNSIVDNEYSVSRYRASTLNSTETTPYYNGTINWVYE